MAFSTFSLWILWSLCLEKACNQGLLSAAHLFPNLTLMEFLLNFRSCNTDPLFTDLFFTDILSSVCILAHCTVVFHPTSEFGVRVGWLLSRLNVGTNEGNKLMCNSSGGAHLQPSKLTEQCRQIVPKRVEWVGAFIADLQFLKKNKKEKSAGGGIHEIFPFNHHVRRKTYTQYFIPSRRDDCPLSLLEKFGWGEGIVT